MELNLNGTLAYMGVLELLCKKWR